MRAALRFLVAAVIAVAVAWGVSLLPGSVSATLGDLTFQTSTPVAVLLAAILFILLYIVIRVLGVLFRSPDRLRGQRHARARHGGVHHPGDGERGRPPARRRPGHRRGYQRCRRVH